MTEHALPAATDEVPADPAGHASGRRLDLVAALIGPMAAAASGEWLLYAAAAFLELTGLVLIGQALWSVADASVVRGSIVGGVILIVLARLAVGFLLRPLRRAALRRRGLRLTTPTSLVGGWWSRAGLAAVLMAFAYGLTLARFLPEEPVAWLKTFPTDPNIAVGLAGWIDRAVEALVNGGRGFFNAVTVGLRNTLVFVETVFMRTPWPVTGLAVLILAWRVAGRRTTIFAAASLAYMGLLGLWEASLSTLALVAVSVLICIVIGLPVGVATAKSPRLKKSIEPVLDVMQTLPTFVYLIPAVALFSIGKPPGVIATVIFALPSMIRLTELGIAQVPANVREAAHAFGATPWQLLWKVELPLAIPSIRLGVNQTIMMCLSMVVVAALIGAGGLGEGVMKSLQFLKTGQGFIVGFAIVLCAMVLDRMVRGREEKSLK